MTRYVTGWKCMNVKAHAAARRTRGVKNPSGTNQYKDPPRPKEKGRWVLTDCPTCGNGRIFDKKRCTLCKKKGKIWTIK
jgi:uncharacterized OB-fold protein